MATLFAGLDLDTDQGKYDAKEKIRKIYDEYGQIKPEAFMKAGAEKLLMNVLSDPRMGSGNGIQIYRKDGDVWGKLKWDSAKNVIKENCTFN
ncbi:hypothetical protein [Chryseobacterium sp. RLHN22]|uniref:hypothetical protein n=1 Tax=Chryseobacterium sp. RLHN22 TaxID=3437885 RepID=UPI003D9B534C